MWKRYGIEVSVVALGILLALGADAGRQYFVDRAQEREILTALRVEFAADVRELAADQRSRSQKMSSIDLLSQSPAEGGERLPSDRLQEALLDTLDWRFYTANHAVLDDLLANGRLSLIRSDELRYALMDFNQARSRLTEVEGEEQNFVQSQMAPYLAQRLNLQAMSVYDASDQFVNSNTTTATGAQNEAVARRARALLDDPTFASLLFLNRDRTDSSFEFAEILTAKVSAVRELLGDEAPAVVRSAP